MIRRREFLGGLAAASCAGCALPWGASARKRITVAGSGLRCEHEPLVRPFGFKGGYLSELWQAIACLESESGLRGIGLGTQSVLWSDAAIFTSRPEKDGNELMLSLTRKALELAKGRSFTTPFELLDDIFPEVLAYGKKASGRPNLRPTFALLAAAAAATALGLVMAFGFGRWSLPIIKNVWTPTFALVAGGYSFAMLAFFYWMIDIRGWTGWVLPFKVIGMNSIAAYVLSRTVLNFYHLKDFLFGGLMRCCATPEWGEFAGELCYMLSYWLLLCYMYRKEVFLKA